MSKREERDDYEVGYGKPQKNRQFKKGISGNPSGRPKKTLNLGSTLIETLYSRQAIKENGRRTVSTKIAVLIKQLVNLALSGNLQAARLVVNLLLQAQESAAEQQKNSPTKRDYENLEADDLTDAELMAIIREGLEKSGDTKPISN